MMVLSKKPCGVINIHLYTFVAFFDNLCKLVGSLSKKIGMVPPREGGNDLSEHTAVPESNFPPSPLEYGAVNKSIAHHSAYADPEKIAEIKDTGIYVCVCVCACMYVCMYVYVCIYVSVCMYVCEYVCVHVCMYVYNKTMYTSVKIIFKNIKKEIEIAKKSKETRVKSASIHTHL